MSNSQLDADLGGNPHNNERTEAAVSKHDLKGSSLKGGHYYLSRMTSFTRGASSGLRWKAGLSRRNHGLTPSTLDVRCHAIAI